ncbi:hypothetical protein AVEN_109726-1 [Araneus ventricosus]|uniref:YqaJ viral recombinase domain-containing protein n=1 Tax=Araneus ventricosus TaxID=182803 RepID=A0A4Y2SVS6_ARAVE|nr:hypothetical protein AVEN_109726-1 [Araneus ventricosus]
MSEAACDEALRKTKSQHKCKLWHELRYGCITASKAYESAQCQTMHGSLVDCILGVSSLKDTNAMKCGKKLEHEVRQLVEKKLGVVIQQCGFHTSPDRPIMGASPDGLSDEYVYEIKCPTSEKAMKNCIVSDGNVVTQHYAQIQMQMYFAKKQKGLFCVANRDFESSKKISMHLVNFDAIFCEELMEKCTKFWETAIFSVLEHYK